MKTKSCSICGQEIALTNYSRHLIRHQNRPESFIKSEYYNRESLNCKYCGKLCKNLSGLHFHEDRCHSNINRIDQSAVVDYKTRYKNLPKETKLKMAWNKDKTALNCESIKDRAIKMQEYYKNHNGTFLNKKHSKETKDKISNSTKAYLIKNNVKGKRHSAIACVFMDDLNRNYGWNLQHALNGGEFHVGKYQVDGYDKDLNIVFEFDDCIRHYIDKYNNIHSSNDIIREKFIIDTLKCRFIRYNPYIDLLYEVIDDKYIKLN